MSFRLMRTKYNHVYAQPICDDQGYWVSKTYFITLQIQVIIYTFYKRGMARIFKKREVQFFMISYLISYHIVQIFHCEITVSLPILCF